MTTTEATIELQRLVGSYRPSWIAQALQEPIGVLAASGMTAAQIIALAGPQFDAYEAGMLTTIAVNAIAALPAVVVTPTPAPVVTPTGQVVPAPAPAVTPVVTPTGQVILAPAPVPVAAAGPNWLLLGGLALGAYFLLSSK